MDITYNIEFHTYWHCGSGLAAGADVDLLTIKDLDGLPYVPGRTMKGLVKEAAEEISSFSGSSSGNRIAFLFGNSADRNTLSVPDADAMRQGVLFFSDAVIEDGRGDIIREGLQPYMYDKISSTMIGDNGVAEDHSLRKMEVSIPCVLHGEILGITDDGMELVSKSLKYIKRLGQNRNRGLGRCTISITGKNERTEI